MPVTLRLTIITATDLPRVIATKPKWKKKMLTGLHHQSQFRDYL